MHVNPLRLCISASRRWNSAFAVGSLNGFAFDALCGMMGTVAPLKSGESKIMLGVHPAVAGEKGIPEDLIPVVLTLMVLVINAISIAALHFGRGTGNKLLKGLLDLYGDNDVDRDYDPSLPTNCNKRYMLFAGRDPGPGSDLHRGAVDRPFCLRGTARPYVRRPAKYLI